MGGFTLHAASGRRGLVRFLGLYVITIVILSGCSASSTPLRVLERSDPLLLTGEEVQVYLAEQTTVELTWVRGFRIPPFVAVSASDVVRIDVPVGTSPTWAVLDEAMGAERGSSLPEYLTISDPIWELSINVFNDAVNVSVPLTSAGLLRRSHCHSGGCDYEFETQDIAASLFRLNLEADDLPVVPRAWLRPFTTVWVVASLSFTVTAGPSYPTERSVVERPYASFEMTGGEARVWIADGVDMDGASSRMEEVSWAAGF